VKNNVNFPIVAVGASAGGLEAFRTLLAALPVQNGMAFILIQHLDPNRTSMLVNLLAPHSAMAVREVNEDMPLEPDHVYIIPPGRFLKVESSTLRLSLPPEGQGVRMPFDILLQSIARACGERAVCVVLSGTGNDGSAGARSVKEAGGLVIVQDPEEAEYHGMPRSVIATGTVDLVLPAAKVPQAIARFGGPDYVRADWNDATRPLGAGFQKIIDLLQQQTPHNFALYKAGTLERRIDRRMALAGIEDSDRYLELLTMDATELQHLINDLFIHVTRFFRDSKAFELLAEKVVPELVRVRPRDRPIRIWVVGSSTGEEAYSIAMLFLEEIAAARQNLKVQIFASDIDADALAVAREGLYPPSIEADVPPARLSRFFIKEDHGYRVSHELRAAIVCSAHDVLSDAPFARLDLISCRNLLIYLRPEVQQRVFSLFHFALREGGTLFLGTAESVGGAMNNFEPISQSQRLYRHLGRGRAADAVIPGFVGDATPPLWFRPARAPARARAGVSNLTLRVLAETYAPASVMATRKHQGLYYFGRIDLYLKTPTGPPSNDLLASAREGLRPAIFAAFERAGDTSKGSPVAIAARVVRDGRSIPVTVNAQAVVNDGEELVLLSFRDAPQHEPKPETAAELVADVPRLARLEQELDAVRQELEESTHDREIAEEEIRAINEEAMSASEEFQTTNEELETSREELQSLNEELTALNGQLQETLTHNQVIADDLENVLNSANVATLFLDQSFRIRFFTPAAKLLFSVIATDVGRPLADLARHFAYGDLLPDAREVIANLVPLTREIEAENGASYAVRILPYRTKENRIEGVVITFVDITMRKQAEHALQAAKVQAESANLGKSIFLAAASHDLREPLQTLSLLQGVLARNLKGTQDLQLVVRCEEAVTAMSGMLNSLLDINQLEAGVIRPEIIDFPVNDVLERMKAEFAYSMQAHGLQFRVVPSQLAVRSDPRLLEQMLRNLVSNAIKYTRSGGVLLGCRRRGDNLRIETWDTGLGIPEGEFDAIFKEFHQIDNPLCEPSHGVGLGLAIVRRLGDLMGHNVDVRSRFGSGSVFCIEVPLGLIDKPIVPIDDEAQSQEIAAAHGTVLIVEDDPALRYSLDILMRADGHLTVTAADGNEAIELATGAASRPDITIVDMRLPGGGERPSDYGTASHHPWVRSARSYPDGRRFRRNPRRNRQSWLYPPDQADEG
jgi:two-component system CheB/CheR fusion protein